MQAASPQIMPQMDMEKVFEDLEIKLTKSIEGVVKTTMAAFKSSFESEMKQLAEKIKDLDSRVTRLEENRSPVANSSSHPHMHGELRDMQTQIKQLTDTMNSQQQILQLK